MDADPPSPKLCLRKKARSDIICKTCDRRFARYYLLKHHTCNVPVAAQGTGPDRPLEPLHILAERQILEAYTLDETSCRYCRKEFACLGNLRRHFTKSRPCNQSAHQMYASIRNA
jgi:hypothetical protein